MRIADKAIQILDRIEDLLAYLAGTMIAFIVAAIIYEVFMRYALNKPTLWVVEIVEVSLLFVTFLCTSWLLKHEGHVTMDIVVRKFSAKTQGIVKALTSAICSMTCLILTIYGVKAVVVSYQLGYNTATELELPQYAILSIIPIGTFLLFIRFLIRSFRALTSAHKRGQK